jgi:hypothetical protein
MIAIAAGCKREPAASSEQTTSAVAPRPAASARWQQVIEAESGSALTAPMVVQDQADASGGKCVAIPLGQPKDVAPTGSIKLTLTAPREAEITLWYRVHWAGTCSNSFTAKVAGQPELIVGEDGTYQTWHWVKTPPLTVPAGPLEVVIVQREEDVRLDQVLVTTDADYVPMGIEE